MTSFVATPPAPEAAAPIVLPADKVLLLYDGVCGLCDKTVRFVLDRDTEDRFRFATLQGDVARAVLAPHSIDPRTLDTFHLVTNLGTSAERVLSRSQGALETLRQVGGGWRWLAAVLGVFPVFLVDVGYRAVARVRYRVFGRLDQCAVPTPAERQKFLD